MDEVVLEQDKRQTKSDEFDQLIFHEQEEGEKENKMSSDENQKNDAPSATQDSAAPDQTPTSTTTRSSVSNVLPMDKLKNGANTASKLFGSAFSSVKNKSSAGWESAKSSSAGTAIGSGWTKAVTVSSEQVNKLKTSDTYKKTSDMAATAYQKTKSSANAGFVKARESVDGLRTKANSVGSNDGTKDAQQPPPAPAATAEQK